MQIGFSLVIVLLVILLVFCKLERIQGIALYFLNCFYCVSTFVLFLCASALVSFHWMESEGWASTLGKIISLGNIFLGISLCGLYKLIAQSYSSVSPN